MLRTIAAVILAGGLIATLPSTSALSEAAKKDATTPATGGRAAAVERQRKCGAEWKADKAAGKVEKGMTWPKYWSACNTRLKAQRT